MVQAILDEPQSLESRIKAMTPRLIRMLPLIASGATIRAMAERWGIREKSVSDYLGIIYGELGVSEDCNLNQRVKAALLYLERFPEVREKYQREYFENLNIKPLTQREYHILFLMAQGYSNRYIREKLFVENGTLNAHITHIYKKLDIYSYEGTNPRVMAMLMFDMVPKPN